MTFEERIRRIGETARPYIREMARRTAQIEAEAFYKEKTMANKMPVPLGKRVMLKKDEAPEASEGGIVIPEQSREKPLTAHVVAVGEEVASLSRGDEVVFASFAGTEFTIGGEEIIVVDEEDIMLVLREVPDDN